MTESFIDGTSVPSAQQYDNIDPATGRSIGAVARGGPDEIDRAVTAARRAFVGWRKTAPAHRCEALVAIADVIDGHRERLALLECEDTGKPLSQARTDITVAARYFRFYGHAIDSYHGQTIPLTEDLHVYTRREPLGVTGHIIAWNYPIQLLARAVAPAIATGNTVVVKPADETPRTAVEFARLAVEVGLPAGIVNVVTGIGAEAGAALAAADRVVPVVLELGGKSPQIVFADADLPRAADFITKAILQNAGQTCSAGSRLLVDEGIHDELLELVLDRFRQVSMGPGIADRDLGPLISHRQQQRVTVLVSGNTTGEILCGGAPPHEQELGDGAYFAPTVIDAVDPASPIAHRPAGDLRPGTDRQQLSRRAGGGRAGQRNRVRLAGSTVDARSVPGAPTGRRGGRRAGVRQHVRRRWRRRAAVRWLQEVRIRPRKRLRGTRCRDSHQDGCGGPVICPSYCSNY